MNPTYKALVMTAGLFAAAVSYAAAPPADAPAGTTAVCKDGSYFSGDTKKGACSGHKGIKTWFGKGDAMAPAAKDKMAAPAAAPAAAAPAAAAPAAAAATGGAMAKTSTKMTPKAEAAPGGGPGMVWANTSSKVYHCNGDKWYGKTKEGAYMSEADAKAKGFHADHGKACS